MSGELFSAGYRPFFLVAALNAWASMLPWLWVLYGGTVPTQGWPPHTLHAHEMIFGTVAPVIAGFLLTAVPNWTQTAPVRGTPLGGLVLLYLAGRVALLLAGLGDPLVVAAIDVAFLPVTAIFVGVPIVRSRNWRNLPVVGSLLGLAAANAAIHHGLGAKDPALLRAGTWAAVYFVVGLMLIISGRVVPIFTRNALRAGGIEVALPDRRPLGACAIALAVAAMVVDWVEPHSPIAAGFAALACLALLARQSGWHFRQTRGKPMLWILHLGHGWLAVGFGCLALSNGFGIGIGAAALHAFTAGAMGTLVLGMMSRVSLGHSGRPIEASRATFAMFVFVIAGAAIRIFGAAGTAESYRPSVLVGGATWTLAWILFTFAYFRVLLTRSNA